MSFLGKTRPKLTKKNLPLLALKDLLVFPGTTAPFFAGRGNSLKSLEASLSEEQEIFLIPQKTKTESPGQDDLHPIGVVAGIVQTLKLPDGTVRVLVEGRQRARLIKYQPKPDYVRAEVQLLEPPLDAATDIMVLFQTIQNQIKTQKELSTKIPKEKLPQIMEASSPDTLVDLIVPSLTLSEEKRLDFFLEENSRVRLENLAVQLEIENQLGQLQTDITKRVKSRMEQNQKEYYLNEQLKEINKELGYDDGDPTGAAELKKKLEKLPLPPEVREKGLKEAGRLTRLQATTPEAGILRTYLDWLTDLPWEVKKEEPKTLAEAQVILNEDHYNMVKAKERILDFIAISQLQEKPKGPILCLSGPPGTGKTSLGRSIARALGRNFVRISLGGVRDEAEIRGHRKTYVGALPGKIIQSMKKAGTLNPVFLLDEIDKMSNDFRGDPAAALLEVLDPEQNSTFVDHYLEVPYDLSNVMFLTTANSLHTIPRPLLDRMEVIEIPGYTDLEKVEIASRFIIPKQLKENGLAGFSLTMEHQALLKIIHGYTMESGVRSLERSVAQVIRKTARQLMEAGQDLKAPEPPAVVISEEKVRELLGVPPVGEDNLLSDSRAGIAHGLAWTETGGKVLPVEVNSFPGKGELILTGSLGDVMKESARIAYSHVKSCHQRWGLKSKDFEGKDLHLHFPEGAIPKDGPSAGITMVAALVSSFTQKPLKPGLAMTGEVTLTGRILPIGGVKEKVLAAFRHKRLTVLLPKANRKDLEEIPQEVREKVSFVFVNSVEEALPTLFGEGTFPI